MVGLGVTRGRASFPSCLLRLWGRRDCSWGRCLRLCPHRWDQQLWEEDHVSDPTPLDWSIHSEVDKGCFRRTKTLRAAERAECLETIFWSG